MGSRSKIVGINREEAETADAADEKAIALGSAEDETSELVLGEDDAVVEEDWEEEYLDPKPARNWFATSASVLLILAFAGWTGFFVWANLPTILAVPSNNEIIAMTGDWAMPTILIGILWLLAMRNSKAEASRFADAGEKLRSESEALEARMRTVNEEIALAREFLAQNAQDLEAVGRQSAEKLTSAAQQLGEALADSDEKAKQLEEVSNAATTNLAQLRKHLPVVTSAAKDVTNQIGSAGNGAQVQVKSLISALNRVNEAGAVARESVDGLEEDAVRAASHISQSIADSSSEFNANIAAAEKSGAEITARFEKIAEESTATFEQTSQRLSEILGESNNILTEKMAVLTSAFEESVGNAQAAVSAASTELTGLLDGGSEKLTAQLADMSGAVENVRDTVDTQDARIEGIVSRIASLIDDSMAQIEKLDDNASDKTSKLAFAIETLVQSTRDLDESIGESNASASGLVERSEKILGDFAAARIQIDEEIPAAIGRIEQSFAGSFESIENARKATGEMDAHSDNLLARLTTIDRLVGQQKTALDGLLASSDEQLTSYSEQAETLSESLAQTRQLIAQMTEETDGKLISSLMNLRETTEETAARSKQLIEEELGNVGDRLSAQNKEMLGNAVDSQLSVLNEYMQGAVMQQLALSQDATDKLSSQLAQIDEMTVNLEARLKDTHDGFGGLDNEGFARRMAMLTESLNSTAIDVAKILSNEVTDTAWASYLKGDRGVFTRRAVRLLDSGEARAIATHYDEDLEFAEHVNRYIHDFEAMMRVLLSTRDGNAVSVTLLSSDVGKLYVALAQAIERLRN